VGSEFSGSANFACEKYHKEASPGNPREIPPLFCIKTLQLTPLSRTAQRRQPFAPTRDRSVPLGSKFVSTLHPCQPAFVT
jgi:hypothetical protein